MPRSASSEWRLHEDAAMGVIQRGEIEAPDEAGKRLLESERQCVPSAAEPVDAFDSVPPMPPR